MKKPTHQMLKALLMSKDLKTGLIAYDLLSGKTNETKVIELLTVGKVPPYDIENKEAFLIFIKNVLSGDINKSKLTANTENKEALSNINALQMLQALLVCEDIATSKAAYEVLAGITELSDLKTQIKSEFLRFVANNNFGMAMSVATKPQSEALTENFKPEYKLVLQSVENYHRLKYICHDQQLDIQSVLNIMIKSYYEVLRADEHAQLMGEDKPQIYFI